NDPSEVDIQIGNLGLTWNRTATDWINSPTSLEEVGSIHTVQGYDLNYAGVIIGPDLGYDPVSKKIVFHRENYHDKKGKENNPRLGIEYTDEDLLNYVVNIYRVLLTRGIKGTFVFVCDPALREQLGQNFDPQL
ncbi:MAG: DNA/RNA helicase domain-containing protein, partial [Aurantimicrobium sp.]